MSTPVASINGSRVTRLSMRIPHTGIPSVAAELDSAIAAAELVGAAEVSVGPLTLSGTFDPLLTGTYLERTECHVIGGAAGWRKQVAAKSYHDDGNGVKAATVLQHLANETGETLGSLSLSRAYLGADWVRRADVAMRQLQLVVGSTPWWVDYAGVTQVGPRGTSEITVPYEVLKPDPGSKVVEVATDDMSGIVIGSILRGRLTPPLVVREISIQVGDGKVRMYCRGAPVESATDAADMGRLLRNFKALLRGLLPRLPYLKKYRFRVVKANSGDNRWILQPISKASLLDPIGPAEVHPGMAGLLAELEPGTEVLVSFVEGDPAAPVIESFQAPDKAGWLPISLTLDASGTVKIGPSDPTVQIGSVTTERATSAESLVLAMDVLLTQIGITIPGALTGAGLAASKAVIINAAIALAAAPLTGTIAAYKTALDLALAAKTADTTGNIPNLGWPKVKGS